MLADTNISGQFIRAVRQNLGEQGAVLLERLPSLLASSIERWELSLEAPFSNLTFNYVVPGHDKSGQAIVLKIGLPTKELKCEAEALKLFNGEGAIRLLEGLPEEGVLLLERALPGESLNNERDDVRAAEIAAATMKRLWVDAPQNSPFPSVADWLKGFSRLRNRFLGGTGPLPEDLVNQAERISQELLASTKILKLLHGDLHQDNIVQSNNSNWVAIDPKGLIGEPEYEVGAFLRNPGTLFDNSKEAEKVLETRLNVFEENLGFSPDRMLKWAFVQAVLSAWWVIEDGGSSFEPALKCAKVLQELMGKNA